MTCLLLVKMDDINFQGDHSIECTDKQLSGTHRREFSVLQDSRRNGNKELEVPQKNQVTLQPIQEENIEER